MERKTTEVKAPVSGAIAFIREWIVAEEADYVQAAILKAVQIKSTPGAGASMQNMDTGAAVQESGARELEVWIEKIIHSGDVVISDPKQIREFVMKEIPSGDRDAIAAGIKRAEEEAKKKSQASATSEPTGSAG